MSANFNTDGLTLAADSAALLSRPEARCSIFVSSCDKYSDLWTPFFTLFFRHWPDCPFPVYLGSNRLPFDHPRVKVLHSEDGSNWTNQMQQQIPRIGTPYVLVWLEDFFLRSRVDTSRVLECLSTVLALDGDMLRLVASPGPDLRVPGYPLIGRCRKNVPYRVSLQVSMWRKEFFLSLLREGESIWQFELAGTERSNAMSDRFYCTWTTLLPYGRHVVDRGRWFRSEARRFGAMNIGCDFSRRPIMTQRETFVAWLHHIPAYFVKPLFPIWKWRQRRKGRFPAE